MLGSSYIEFLQVFKVHFSLINNTLIYKNIRVELPNYYSPEFYSDKWNLYDLFFRFKHEMNAFKYYKTFLEYDYVIKMCETFVHIYNINKLYKNKSIYLQELNDMDLFDLRYLVNTKDNSTENKRIFDQSVHISPD
jgi:hypothetical protein